MKTEELSDAFVPCLQSPLLSSALLSGEEMKATPQTQFTGPELCSLEAHEVVRLLRRGEVSPDELLDACFARIESVEAMAPSVNAVVTRCEKRARDSVAGLAPLAARNGAGPGWLAGLPIAIKDATNVAGVRTTFGSKGFADHVPVASAPLVERLEDTGGIVVGKTNLPEFGAGANTFNDIFGMTRNPWDLRRNAGGSSGGAAVSLATGEVWLSHGSDLTGSLRTPAAFCGVVGLRPSPGRVVRGPDANAFTMEGVQGPMARSVMDCALFLDAMVGFDARSPLSLEAPCESFQEAVRRALPTVRIAYSPDLGGFSPVTKTIDTILRDALREAERNGATVEEKCPELPDLERTHTTLRAMTWAAGAGSAPIEIRKHFKKTLADNIEFGRRLKIEDVYEAQLARTRLYHIMRQFLQNYDVLACPTVGLEPGPVEEEYPTEIDGKPLVGYVEWLRFSYLTLPTGLPAISLPVGFTESGMPVGLQLIGPPRGEAVVLAAARAVELAVGGPLGPIDPRLPN
jgi:amidase